MDIQITGKQIDIGDALRTHVSDKLGAGVGKYFERSVDAQVSFSREGAFFRADATVHLATGIRLHAHADAGEIYAAFDEAVEKLEKRLRRYKRKLKDHHAKRREPVARFSGQSYVLAPEPETEVDLDGDGDGAAPAGTAAGEEWQPLIVAEEQTDIPVLSVGEAVMQLEFIDAPVLVFKNGGTGRINVVYRRPDSHIGWIDPTDGG